MSLTAPIQTHLTPAFNVQVNSILIVHREDKVFAARVYEKNDNVHSIILKTTLGIFGYEHTESVELALLY